ncbi:Uncharacterised protein [Mycobacterium tuberculosis]|uniref:Uncharacterized protein n=1 Tax=Mycobacterium tuberculosis TaxID=1773 RepID=A0A0U0QSV4_MYCTX|nr:Uncharacterised protein [Mycobacterium tuberculosis]COV33177.1 Uncharacterised protein [Mycobacterium tuberculosis]COW40411.1 Uncharacterised protein [Mycobacterium tuberculosis]COW48829.1 Uncharacterised protein [Mycobacterium tuberculosis]COW72994.1 Uncharacterised protein [Mycobacterium tuberculosis]
MDLSGKATTSWPSCTVKPVASPKEPDDSGTLSSRNLRAYAITLSPRTLLYVGPFSAPSVSGMTSVPYKAS